MVGHSSPSAFQKPQRAVGDGEFGRDGQTSVLQIEQQLPPILGAFARAVGEAEQLLLALRRRADDHQDALLGVFKSGLQVNDLPPEEWTPGYADFASACSGVM